MTIASGRFLAKRAVGYLTVAILMSFLPLHAQVTQDRDLWFVCNATNHPLPTTATLTAQNPQNARNFTWVVTAGADKVAFSNNMARINTNVPTVEIHSLAASAAMNDVTINVNFAVANNVNHQLTVRRPRSLRPTGDTDEGRGARCNVGGNQGYLSRLGYEVLDQFTNNTGNAGINEELGAKIDDQRNNWGVGREGGAGTPGGRFADRVCVTGGGMPQPTPPQNPLGNNRVDRIPQTWFAGDDTNPANHTGCRVQTDDIQRFIDHGRHINIVSPPQGGGVYVGSIAQGMAPRGLFPTGKHGNDRQQPRSFAYPTPVQDVVELQRQAAVVIKGTVTEVHEDPSVAARVAGGTLAGSKPMVASIQVTRVLKGNALENGIVSLAFADNSYRLPFTLTPGDSAILFLKEAASGVYTFVDPFVGKMPVTNRYVAASSDATTLELLQAEIVASLDDPNRAVAQAALEQIGNFGRISSTLALQNIANAGEPEFRALAYAALIRLHDYSAFDAGLAFATNSVTGERYQPLIAEAVGSVRDSSMVSKLGELLSSPSVLLRRAAARALRASADPTSLQYLAPALNDSDAEVRYDAVMAMAHIAGSPSDWTPARDTFDKDATAYVLHWQNWWSSRN